MSFVTVDHFEAWAPGKQRLLRRMLVKEPARAARAGWSIGGLCIVVAAYVSFHGEMGTIPSIMTSLGCGAAFVGFMLLCKTVRMNVRPVSLNTQLFYSFDEPLYKVIFQPSVREHWEECGAGPIIDSLVSFLQRNSRLTLDKAWFVREQAVDDLQHIQRHLEIIGYMCKCRADILVCFEHEVRSLRSLRHAMILGSMSDVDHGMLVAHSHEKRWLERQLGWSEFPQPADARRF